MKILLIHNFYQYWGGEDTYVTSLKKLLEDYGHKVYLYSKDSKNIKTFWDKMRAAIGLFYNPWIKKELAKIIKEFKPNIAHFHNVYPLIGATAYRICKKYNIPIIQHIHNYRFMCPKGILFRNGKICELCVRKNLPFYSIIFGCYHSSRLASLFFSFSFFFHKIIGTFNLVDKFIFPSEFTKGYYLKHLKIHKEKTDILAHFVDIKPIKKEVKKEDYFLYVGRLSEEKGIIQLLNVFKKLPKIKLIVVGDGPLGKELYNRKYKKFLNITFKKFIPENDKLIYMTSALTTIIPSLAYEQGPLVLLESYACGIPVLVPKFTNFIYSVKNKKTGIFYRYNDEKDLKRKLLRIVGGKYNITKMKDFLKKEYGKIYSPKKHFINLLEIYKQIYKHQSISSRIFSN